MSLGDHMDRGEGSIGSPMDGCQRRGGCLWGRACRGNIGWKELVDAELLAELPGDRQLRWFWQGGPGLEGLEPIGFDV